MRNLARALLVAAGAAGAALLLRRFGLREDLDWETAQRPGRLVEVEGYRVHVVERGSGPAMLMLHGFGAHTWVLRHQVAAFSATHRVIAPDLKGFGYSERVRAGLSGDDQVRMLHGLLRTLGVERATVVGHSMGGGIAMRFAATHPEMTEALVLVASVTGQERMQRVRLPKALLRPLMPVLSRVTAHMLLRASYHDRSKLTPEAVEALLEPTRIRGSMDGLLAMLTAPRAPMPALSGVRCPVLLLWGAEDRVTPLKNAREIRARLPQAQLTVIGGAGHMVLEERPEETNRAIADFLREAVAALHGEPAHASGR